MYDERGPEGLPRRRETGYGKEYRVETDRKQQYIYPGTSCLNQEPHQYTPENPGDE